jgi:hypothetical protein
MKKNKINKELEELSSFLSNLKKDKKDAFSIPENYFDKFEDRLMHRIEEEAALSPERHSEKKVAIPFFSRIKAFFRPHYAIGFSTCLLLIIGSFYVLKPVDSPTNLEIMEGLLADGSIDSYIDDHIEDFRTEDIVASLGLEELIDIQEDIIGEEELNSDMLSKEKPTETIKSSMDKALDAVEMEDLLDDLTEEDLELLEEDLF